MVVQWPRNCCVMVLIMVEHPILNLLMLFGNQLAEKRSNLPIASFKDEITAVITNHQVCEFFVWEYSSAFRYCFLSDGIPQLFISLSCRCVWYSTMKMDIRLFKLVSGGRVHIYFFCLSMLFRWFSLLGKQAVARLHRCAQDSQHFPSRDYKYSFVHQILTDSLSGCVGHNA